MTDQAPVWPEDVGWRVRMGAGLLSAAPLNDSLREAHRREDEKERAQAERDAEMRASAAAERLGELRMKGVVPRTQEEFLAQVGWAQDRQDAIEAQREKAAAELAGRGKPREWVGQLAAVKADRKAREAAEASTPASQADLGKVKQQIASFKVWAHGVTGKKPW